MDLSDSQTCRVIPSHYYQQERSGMRTTSQKQKSLIQGEENIQMSPVMSVGVWFLVIYVRYLGGQGRPVAAG